MTFLYLIHVYSIKLMLRKPTCTRAFIDTGFHIKLIVLIVEVISCTAFMKVRINYMTIHYIIPASSFATFFKDSGYQLMNRTTHNKSLVHSITTFINKNTNRTQFDILFYICNTIHGTNITADQNQCTIGGSNSLLSL